jgi:hypothetical protein
MRKVIIYICFCLFLCTASWAQENGRISLSANFGLNGNFFVRSYDESGPGILFYEKNFAGVSGGAEIKFRLNRNSFLTLGYMESTNKRVVDFYGANNNIELYIQSFNISHKEHIFYAGYERNLFKRYPEWKVQGGIYYVKFAQQEIELLGNSINIWERNQRNAGLNELGVFIGFQYSRKIDTHFDLGLQSRLFYEFTSNTLEQVTLTPTLTYHFSKSKRKKSA